MLLQKELILIIRKGGLTFSLVIYGVSPFQDHFSQRCGQMIITAPSYLGGHRFQSWHEVYPIHYSRIILIRAM
jgi:hypothetical protein